MLKEIPLNNSGFDAEMFSARRRFYNSKAFKELAEKLGIEVQNSNTGLILKGSKNSIDAVLKAYDEFLRCEKTPEKSDLYLSNQIDEIVEKVNSTEIKEVVKNESIQDLIKRQEKATQKEIEEEERKKSLFGDKFKKIEEEKDKDDDEEYYPGKRRYFY